MRHLVGGIHEDSPGLPGRVAVLPSGLRLPRSTTTATWSSTTAWPTAHGTTATAMSSRPVNWTRPTARFQDGDHFLTPPNAPRVKWRSATGGDWSVSLDVYGHKPDVGVGNGGELFFTQYSFMAFDPSGRRDRYTNYFQNNRNIALISHDYSVENPRLFCGYGDNARAAPPA
jgi:hypothetical protein